MKIEDIILKVLKRDKTVYIKGLGQLSIDNLPVYLDPKTNSFTPPKTTIIFHPVEKFDITLTKEISEQQNISFQEAENYIYNYSSSLKNSINNSGYGIIEGVCLVKKEMTNWYSVTVLDNSIINNSNFGLEEIQPKVIKNNQENITPIIIPPINDKKNIDKEIENVENVKIQEPNEQEEEEKKSYLWLVFLLIILGGLGIFGFVFKDELVELFTGDKKEISNDANDDDDFDNDIINIDDTINKKDTLVIDTISGKEKKKKRNNDYDDGDYSYSNYSSVEYTSTPDYQAEITYAPRGGNLFYVVTATPYPDFSSVSFAVSSLKQKGYVPIVIEKNSEGFFRVAYKEGFWNREAAEEYLKELNKTELYTPLIFRY